MAFTRKNVTRSTYKRVKRVNKTNKRRSQKCVKGGEYKENLKKIVDTINDNTVNYYVVTSKTKRAREIMYGIRKFTLPTTKYSILKGTKPNFNKLIFSLDKEEKEIERKYILPSLLMFKYDEKNDNENDDDNDENLIRRARPGCILRNNDGNQFYEIDVGLSLNLRRMIDADDDDSYDY